MSLRLAAAAEKKAQEARQNTTGGKCPIPRPILNILTRRDSSSRSTSNTAATSPSSESGINGATASSSNSSKKPRTNKEYVADQIVAFQERYGSLPGYNYAEAYLESVLSLATTGEESPRVKEVSEHIGLRFQVFQSCL